MSNYKLDTICVQGGYKPGNSEPRTLPIYQSTTYKYDSADHLGDLFDLKADGHMYSRISNPTLACVEDKIAEMEGGVGAMLTDTGRHRKLIKHHGTLTKAVYAVHTVASLLDTARKHCVII